MQKDLIVKENEDNLIEKNAEKILKEEENAVK